MGSAGAGRSSSIGRFGGARRRGPAFAASCNAQGALSRPARDSLRGDRGTAGLAQRCEALRDAVVRMADRKLPFGGTCSFDIAPAPDGGSELRITEDGEIYNVIFRFVSRFLLGYTASIEGYFRDLGANCNQAVEIEA
jgi:hypothetical protein